MKNIMTKIVWDAIKQHVSKEGTLKMGVCVKSEPNKDVFEFIGKDNKEYKVTIELKG